jgi:class 3 adenylate cyclase
MGAEPLKRKLAAILATDAVGYSRHMAADEEGTLRILSAHRAVIDGIIEFHEGRILGTAGDSVLAEFASPVQAVRCAVEIQDALRTRNDSLPEDKRLLFRIGINLGDVMIKGDDLLGDGVNVAARLESIAEPGGICISSSVYDQIAGKLDLGFVDQGQKALKNIDRPVRIYRVERDGAGRRTATRRSSASGAAAKWVGGAALIAALAAGAWHFVLMPLEQTARDAEARAERAAAGERKRAEELATARDEAAAARKSDEAEAARRQAVAEAARQRAEAQAAEARRALEAQRANAEIARARAEAEDARRQAAAELAAAAEARRRAEAGVVAPAAAPPVSLKEGSWSAQISCPPFNNFPGRNVAAPLAVQDDVYVLEHGGSNAPGSLVLRGRMNDSGTLRLRGIGITGKLGGAKPYPAGFEAKPVGEGYEGQGRLGRRECTLAISRAG